VKAGSRFSKKAAQKLLFYLIRDLRTPLAQFEKVFLLLFLQKKQRLPFRAPP